MNWRRFLILTVCAALLDSLLWILFVGEFDIPLIARTYCSNPSWFVKDVIITILESVALVCIGTFSGRFILGRVTKHNGVMPHLVTTFVTFALIYAVAVGISYVSYRVLDYYSVDEFRMSVVIIGSLSCLFTLVILMEDAIAIVKNEFISRQSVEAERLKKDNMLLRSELEKSNLKADNHFLFNCLGMLSEQMTENPSEAKRTLDGLLAVAKYMNANLSRPAIRVSEEMEFIREYFGLMKKRFPFIRLEISADAAAADGYVVPLSLQTLIENAIKHNVHTSSCPLAVSVGMENGRLTVSNTLQPVASAPFSGKAGLDLLKNRYAALTQTPVEVRNDGKVFSVSIPLLTRFD